MATHWCQFIQIFCLTEDKALQFLQSKLLCWRREDLGHHLEIPMFRAGTILTISLL